MDKRNNNRNKSGVYLFCSLSLLVMFLPGCQNRAGQSTRTEEGLNTSFPVKPEELTLRFAQAEGERLLSFSGFEGTAEEWRARARAKLKELLDVRDPDPGRVREVRRIEYRGVQIRALIMEIDGGLSIPAYLLTPSEGGPERSAVMAIHGHGRVEPCIGTLDDYHHSFALELAGEGHTVLCPELRGFGALRDLAAGEEINRLDYWIGGYSQFTLVTDGFLYGSTLIGETVEDLLRWEEWFVQNTPFEEMDVAGISYGGDLSIIYPAFSRRIGRIFCSGSLGSFSVIFRRCYNAPAHCIPGILKWMDRSDIAGLSAPRPIAIHFGELDTPSPTNASASYNETVSRSLEELREIYGAFDGEGAVSLIVSMGKHHEFDIPELLEFLSPEDR